MSDRERDRELVEASMTAIEHLATQVRLDAVVATQLSIQQLKVLMLAVHRAPITAHDVAEALGVSAATVSGIVARLVARGLLVQRPDPADRRSRHLTATRAGEEALSEIASIQVAQRKVLLDRLTDDEVRALATSVQAIERALREVLGVAPSQDG